jgi:hypothetical protein
MKMMLVSQEPQVLHDGEVVVWDLDCLMFLPSFMSDASTVSGYLRPDDNWLTDVQRNIRRSHKRVESRILDEVGFLFLQAVHVQHTVAPFLRTQENLLEMTIVLWQVAFRAQ